MSQSKSRVRIPKQRVEQRHLPVAMTTAQIQAIIFPHTHAASDTISGTFADARIAQSNVTQHEAALDHTGIQNIGTLTHAEIETSLDLKAIGATNISGTTADNVVLFDDNLGLVLKDSAIDVDDLIRASIFNTFANDNTFEGDITLETGIVQEEVSLVAASQSFTPNFNVAARQIADCSGFSTGSITLNNLANLTAGKTIDLLIIGPSADLPLSTSASWNALDGSLSTLKAGEDVEVTFYCRGAAQTDVWYRVTRPAPPPHTIASHSDTSATGTELDTLTDGSDADSLHTHGRHAMKTGWDIDYSSEVSLSFTDGTRTFEIAPTGASFSYWIQGVEYTKSSAESVVITDTEGPWFIYFAGSTLTASQTPWEIEDADKAFVSMVYWDATNNVSVTESYELHSWDFPPTVHDYCHDTFGARWESGLAVTINGTTTIDVTAGTIFDEDLPIAITDGAGGSLFEQVLSPAECPILYRTGASGDWRYIAASTVPCYLDTNVLQYNEWTGATWQLSAVSSNRYCAYWVIASSDLSEPVYLVPGQEDGATLANARDGNSLADMQFGDLPTAEHKVIARLLIQRKVASPYYEVVEVADYRNSVDEPSSGAIVGDHGGLTGLGDDDHTQYLLADGSRVGSSSGAQDFGSTGIEADVIAESTAAAGVTVDGVLIKDGEIGGDNITHPIVSKTGSYVMAAGDSFVDVDATGGSYTIIPLNPTTNAGKLLGVAKNDSSANAVTVNPAGANTINGSLTYVLSSQYDAVMFMSNGTEYRIFGTK